MKIIFKYAYGTIGLFVIPVLVGGGVADLLINIYRNFDSHWVAGAVVCLLSGTVVSWLPMMFLISSDNISFDKSQMGIFALSGLGAGIFAPLIFGFRNLGIIIAVCLCVTIIVTVLSAPPRETDAPDAYTLWKSRNR